MNKDTDYSQCVKLHCEWKDIMFVQGDSVEVWFFIEGVDVEQIDHLVLRSKKANLVAHCPYSSIGGGFCFRLTPEQTSILPATIASYDLVANYKDGSVLTLGRECGFAVLKQRNIPMEGDYAD